LDACPVVRGYIAAMIYFRILPVVVAVLVLVACGGGDPVEETNPIETDPTEATNDGWETIEEGLQIRDVVEGDGAEVESGDVITAHYTLWLYEDEDKGAEIESSRGGDPFTATVGVGELIEGWDLGIPGMNVGGTRELIIDSDLAYGDTGVGADIPGGATLFFEVEMVDVE
jgi:FKBP-type peptidyl-prolyl cis-trans isomerase